MIQSICAFRLAIVKTGASIAANTTLAASASTLYKITGINANTCLTIRNTIVTDKMTVVKKTVTIEEVITTVIKEMTAQLINTVVDISDLSITQLQVLKTWLDYAFPLSRNRNSYF